MWIAFPTWRPDSRRRHGRVALPLPGVTFHRASQDRIGHGSGVISASIGEYHHRQSAGGNPPDGVIEPASATVMKDDLLAILFANSPAESISDRLLGRREVSRLKCLPQYGLGKQFVLVERLVPGEVVLQ